MQYEASVRNNLVDTSLITRVEREGYCLIKDAIPENNLSSLIKELGELENKCKDIKNISKYMAVINEPLRFIVTNLQFEDCPQVHQLIASGIVHDFVSNLMGDELVCMGCVYVNCKPGFQGVSIHSDYDPYTSNVFRPNNPVVLRVVFYLDDVTSLNVPMRVIPYSHLSLNKNKNYTIEFNDRQNDEIELTFLSGTAIVMNPKIFHGAGPNLTTNNRRALAITYRPRWAAPVGTIEDYNEDKLSALPSFLVKYFRDQNLGIYNSVK